MPHGYIANDQLHVIRSRDDQKSYFIKGSYVWDNSGHTPSQVFERSSRGGLNALFGHRLEAVAIDLDVTLHPSEEEAMKAHIEGYVTTDWQEVAERLFGSDWIAPLSEVMAINRRTIERWRSGAVPIPPSAQDSILAVSKAGRDTLTYGALLRMIANGQSTEGLHEALRHFEEALADGDPIAISARDRISHRPAHIV